eukprot:1156347-Pelagomonas_calceolata.AAC.5
MANRNATPSTSLSVTPALSVTIYVNCDSAASLVLKAKRRCSGSPFMSIMHFPHPTAPTATALQSMC